MPEPKCIMVSIFIDDCVTATSPLLAIPGSQKHGLLDSSLHRDAGDRGYELHNIDREALTSLAEEGGIEPLIGLAGTVAFVHCNAVHGSANNVSPWRRAIAYLNFNAVSNACTSDERPWYQNNRDFTPIQTISDSALADPSHTEFVHTGRSERITMYGWIWAIFNCCNTVALGRFNS